MPAAMALPFSLPATSAAPRPDQTLASDRRARGAALAAAFVTLAIATRWIAPADTVWIAAIVAALALAGERRHAAMLACCGIAVAVDRQASIAMPFFIALALSRGVGLRIAAIAPAAALALLAGAWATGWPLHDAASRTIATESLAHFWSIVALVPWLRTTPFAGLAIAATVGANACYIAWFGSRPLDRHMLAAAALLPPLATATLFPWVGPAGVALNGVLALAFALDRRTGQAWRIALLVLVAPVASLAGHPAIGGIAMVVATAMLVRHLLPAPAANDNPRYPRAVSRPPRLPALPTA